MIVIDLDEARALLALLKVVVPPANPEKELSISQQLKAKGYPARARPKLANDDDEGT
jgi:hypothetical protein